MFGASMNQRKDGNEDNGKIIKEMSNTTPSRGKKIRDDWKKHQRQQKRANDDR